MYNIFWGLGNKTYLPLMCLIPIFNIVWILVCGTKGNEWAWKKENYKDTDAFLAVQKTWNRAGIFQFVITIIALAGYIFFLYTLTKSTLDRTYNY